jgi:hypothetical protein
MRDRITILSSTFECTLPIASSIREPALTPDNAAIRPMSKETSYLASETAINAAQ